MNDAESIRRQLGLLPHPEGGHYAETWRSATTHPHPAHGAPRALSTAIYFLLARGEYSRLHRVESEESWHLYAGGPAELHLLSPAGAYSVVTLGMDLTAGDRPQAVVPAGWWQATRLAAGTDYALFGCIVAPGFDFADFSMPTAAEIGALFPQHAEQLARLTRG
jgi:predicted cupin superfamily sugar epimerase